MRIALVVPPQIGSTDDEEHVEYLGLGYIAAGARQAGHHVDILDCKSQLLTHGEAVSRIQALDPRVIGITAPFSVDLTSAVKLSQHLRATGFDGAIVVGGHPASFTFQNLLRLYPAIDVVVRGEGEITFLDLVQHWDRREEWCQVAGIAYQDHGQIAVSPARPLIRDLDSLPLPARDNVATDGMPASAIWCKAQGIEPGTMILSSRGCPFRCSYCSVQAFYRASPGRAWRCRSVRDVVDEMSSLSESWGFRSFQFTDDNFFGSCREGKLRAEQLAVQLMEKDLGFNFILECRTTDVEFRLFSLLKRAGLVGVNLGIESGVPAMLRRFNKHASPEQNKNAISLLKDLGINCHPNFILVDPETTLEELRENLSFFKETRLYLARHATQILYTNRLGLFAGTPAREHYVSRGRTSAWKYADLTEEEQVISNNLEAMLNFEEQDPRVTDVIRLLERVIPELNRQDRVLASLERQLDRHTEAPSQPEVPVEEPPLDRKLLLSRIGHWRANAGKLAFQLFEKAVVSAEKGILNPETAEDHREAFLAEVERYNNLHFGKKVDDLEHEIAKAPAVQ